MTKVTKTELPVQVQSSDGVTAPTKGTDDSEFMAVLASILKANESYFAQPEVPHGFQPMVMVATVDRDNGEKGLTQAVLAMPEWNSSHEARLRIMGRFGVQFAESVPREEVTAVFLVSEAWMRTAKLGANGQPLVNPVTGDLLTEPPSEALITAGVSSDSKHEVMAVTKLLRDDDGHPSLGETAVLSDNVEASLVRGFLLGYFARETL